MSNLAPKNQMAMPNVDVIRNLILNGDLSNLNSEQKVAHYKAVCDAIGINFLTKPFDYIRFQGKEVLYANKGCAEQLRQIHQISIRIVAREKMDDVYVVTAEASDPSGRVDSSTGVVPILNLKGENLANAMLKCETKAKRRVTLSICGLNMLDETEAETIEGARMDTHQASKMIESDPESFQNSKEASAPIPLKKVGDTQAAPGPVIITNPRKKIGMEVMKGASALLSAGIMTMTLDQYVLKEYGKSTMNLSDAELSQLHIEIMEEASRQGVYHGEK